MGISTKKKKIEILAHVVLRGFLEMKKNRCSHASKTSKADALVHSISTQVLIFYGGRTDLAVTYVRIKAASTVVRISVFSRKLDRAKTPGRVLIFRVLHTDQFGRKYVHDPKTARGRVRAD